MKNSKKFSFYYTEKIMTKINQEKCIGCGLCQNLCPEIFEMKDDKAKIKERADFKKNKDCIKESKESCPVEAIE